MRRLLLSIALLALAIGMVIVIYFMTGGGTDEGEGTENPSYNTVQEVTDEETTQVVELPATGGQ